jgi:hypothetical protein
MPLRCTVLLSLVCLFACHASAFGDEPPLADADLRPAVARALPLLTKGAIGHRENRTCFACHNQGIPILAITTARSRGFEIDEAELATQLQFIADFLSRNRANYLLGKGQGGQVDTAGYALLTLELGGWKPDETTAAVMEYLLQYQIDSPYWRANSNRPPSEASPFTTTYVGLRALATFGLPEQQDQIALRTKAARQWLLETKATSTEDRAFKLHALKTVGAGEADLAAATKELLATQKEDGGFAQLDSGDEFYLQSDAYATGTALVALHLAGGLATTDPVYRRGLAFLLKTQQADGSWHVKSRSKPFQAYFETGFPHGNDQFISSAATAWATTALALACDSPSP